MEAFERALLPLPSLSLQIVSEERGARYDKEARPRSTVLFSRCRGREILLFPSLPPPQKMERLEKGYPWMSSA